MEDLERQVQELQAAVNGLTEELVETKARLQDLEAAEHGEPEPPEEPSEVPAERTTKSDVHADVVEANPEAKRAEESSADAAADGDAATGEDTADESVEADKSEEPDESSGDGESEESDIIVA
ncbi:hypothetical protein AArcSl_1512 [Halalkaliarchaeum desulfuricum]|uniref:Chromosome segregation protein SMC n=1 Tax=Halalkaliarchaeum desulfuricum TaxID=2055893 RepID=A0A343TJ69_9EURY|nr:hypothetical protein AArcSl_1512 [Halalkaliarchaeum desulfuricum]